MAVTRCDAGHYYDDVKYSECPHCKNNLSPVPRPGLREDKTVFGAARPDVAAAALRPQVKVDLPAPQSAAEEKTVGIFRTEKGHDPVAGWLVCTAGGERGRDFRLFAGRNFIGRSLKSAVALVDDERISREDHCSIVYEPRRAVFVIARGHGDGVLVNGARLETTLPLQTDDVIEIGGSTFVFVAFCREGRSW